MGSPQMVDLRKRYAEFMVAKGQLIEALCCALDAHDGLERPSENKDLSNQALERLMGTTSAYNPQPASVRIIRLVIEATLAIPQDERFEALRKETE